MNRKGALPGYRYRHPLIERVLGASRLSLWVKPVQLYRGLSDANGSTFYGRLIPCLVKSPRLTAYLPKLLLRYTPTKAASPL